VTVLVTPNLLAFVALVLWVPATVILFRSTRPSIAVAVSLVAAVLLLPERVELTDLPALPPLDKQVVAALSALLASALLGRRQLFGRPSREWVVVVVLMALSALGTSFTNGDGLTYAHLHLPGMSFLDAVNLFLTDMIVVVVPFFLSRAAFRTPRDLRDLYSVVIGAAIVYVPLAVVEMRLSPQLHNWAYGFHQHAFIQTVRGSGYRPMVFMAHGLALAFFFATALFLAAGQSRIGAKVLRVSTRIWTAVLAGTLLLCRSMGSAIYGILLLPVVLGLRDRVLVRIAAALAVLAVLYPALRSVGAIPTEALVGAATSLDPVRASSLEIRFVNEDALLDRAKERILFGWGTYGRSRVFDAYGQDRSVTDGWWIIQLGSRGVSGYLIDIGLLLIPVFLALKRFRAIATRADRVLVATLALVSALGVVELIPNGLFSYLPFFFSGALSGIVRKPPEASRSGG
jgi:hypothetical protein